MSGNKEKKLNLPAPEIPAMRTAHGKAKPPQVGIFWVINYIPKGRRKPIKKLLLDSLSYSEGEEYGGFRQYAHGHYSVWETMKKLHPQIDSWVEYEEFPRGRVTCRAADAKFFVYLDRCIKNDPAMMKQIFTRMRLPPTKTMVAWDEHYLCNTCRKKD